MTSATVDDVLSLLDEMNEKGRIEYADYSQLHDAIAATLGRGAEQAMRCLDCRYQLDGVCMLHVGHDYRRELVDDDYFCASWEERA